MSFCLAYASMLAGCGDSYEKISIVEEKCSRCHSTEQVYSTKRTKDGWDRVVHGMKVSGLKLTQDEEKELMNELYNKLGK